MNNTDRNLLIATYVLLFVYNVFFGLGKWFPELPVFGASYEFLHDYRGTLTFLELLGVLTIFVEMVINFDVHEGVMKNLKLASVVALTFAFIAKLFVNYMDSALLQ